MAERVLLGQIVGVHGIRGEVVIKTFTAEPESIADYGPLTDPTGRTHVVEHVRVTAKGVVARLAGLTDRTAAEKLRGTELYVPRDRLPEPDEGEFYYEDLVGLAAVTPDGQPLGEIVAVQNFGAGDLLEIRFPERNQTDFIPFTEACVPTVDLATRRVTIVRPVYAADEPGDEPAPKAE